MKRDTCPYLGLKEDPTTAMSFPSEGNFCHHAKPTSPVKTSYQAARCLTEGHTACPLYKAARPTPMPVAIMTNENLRARNRRLLAIIGVPLILAAVAAFTFGWNVLGSYILANRPIPNTGAELGPSDGYTNKSGVFTLTTLTPFSPVQATESKMSAIDNCPMPAGWVIYQVTPTDSLFRLSLIYGVTVKDLQQVNCMDDSTVVLPGQLIYVPYIPTNTPFSQNTAVPQQAQKNNISPPAIAPPILNTDEPAAKTATRRPSNTDTAAPSPTQQQISTNIVPTGTNTSVPTRTGTATPVNTTRPVLPPTATRVTPTRTPVPPTNTSVPPTSTRVIPTRTPVPPTATRVVPTNTPVVPTATQIIPTRTPVPPTATDPPPPPPPPTATDPPPPPPLPTATDPPTSPPTATNPPSQPDPTDPPLPTEPEPTDPPPPPQPEPTDPPEPTAADPPPPPQPEPTNPPEPQPTDPPPPPPQPEPTNPPAPDPTDPPPPPEPEDPEPSETSDPLLTVDTLLPLPVGVSYSMNEFRSTKPLSGIDAI